MKETLRHKEVFEQYYVMGEDRSLAKLRKKMTSLKLPYKVVSLRTLQTWSKVFNWQYRTSQRDMDIAKELSTKTDKTIIAIKADYRAEIKAQFNILKKMLNKLIEQFKNDKGIEIKDVTGLKDVLGCYERLIKMDLTLIGEESEEYLTELQRADEMLFNKINDMVKRIKTEKKTRRKVKHKKITKK